jgi:hypothetical protein
MSRTFCARGRRFGAWRRRDAALGGLQPDLSSPRGSNGLAHPLLYMPTREDG